MAQWKSVVLPPKAPKRLSMSTGNQYAPDGQPVIHAILRACRMNSTRFHATNSSVLAMMMQMMRLNLVQPLKKNLPMRLCQLGKTWKIGRASCRERAEMTEEAKASQSKK